MQRLTTARQAGLRRCRSWPLVFLLAGGLIPALADSTPCEIVEPASEPSLVEVQAAERFQRARDFAAEGRYDAAIVEYRRLSRRYPDNVDYRFGEAQARYWSGQSDCALQLLARSRELAPDYEAVWELEHQVLLRMEDGASRHRLAELRAAARARFPQAVWLREERPPGAASYRWETGFNRESLNNGAEDWQNIYVHFDRRWPGGALASLTVTEHRRFALSDKELTFGGAFKPSDHWLLSAAVGTAPGAAFLPETVLRVGASRQLPRGWVAGVDLRYRSYPQQSVSSTGAGIERYFGNFRAAYHVEQTRLASASSWSHRGVVNWYAESGSRYGLTVAAGKEMEVIVPGQLLEMDVSAIALSGRHPVSERLSVIWRVGTHRQGSIYRRNNLGLSLAGEF